MTNLRRLLKDYRESGALHTLVSVHAALDEPVFLTKGGELVAFLAMRGPDAECLDESQRDAVARRFQSALRIFDENFRVYQYLIKRDQPVMAPEARANPILQEAMEKCGRGSAGERDLGPRTSAPGVFAVGLSSPSPSRRRGKNGERSAIFR